MSFPALKDAPEGGDGLQAVYIVRSSANSKFVPRT
jgi:hypothetical protein